jgi:type VII secretion protein EccB
VPSRQDQLHSYQYSLQRVVAALVTHDPDPHRSPLRRAGTTALISVVVAALAVTGAAVWGILTGAGTDKIDDESAVYMDKSTGARYVFLKSDDRLHPVINYASGLLIANGDRPDVVGASSKSLAQVPLGETLGITGAPDALPGPGDLVTGAWSVCTQAPDAGAPAHTPPSSTVLIGTQLTDGVAAGPNRQALLIGDPAGETFLVYGNRKFQIPDVNDTVTLRALGWGNQPTWPVSRAWSNAIPQGADVVPPAIPGFGGISVVSVHPEGGGPVAPVRIGQLITVADSSEWAVAMADGAAGVTDVQARLLQTVRNGRSPVKVSTSEFNNLRPSTTKLGSAADPDSLPAVLPAAPTLPNRSACVTPVAGRDDLGLRIDPTVPAGTPVNQTSAARTPAKVRADFVVVPLGRGALVAAVASRTAPVDTAPVSVVTATGQIYSIPGRDLLARLGYGGVAPRPVPSQLTDLLAEGPALSADKARRPPSVP